MGGWRRTFAGTFACLVISVMVLDALPWQIKPLQPIKRPLSAVLDRMGLWQGEWSMFAPDPVINNGWLSAEMQTSDGRQLLWESPFWSQASTYEKFVRFRSINFFNRLPQQWNISATDDFMDYLARNSGEQIVTTRLYRNQVRLIMPADGTLPLREEAEWQLIPEPWVQRRMPP